MSRFVIVSVAAAGSSPARAYAEAAAGDAAEVDAGCAWLFSAAPRVDDPEESVREAVREYFATVEGQRVRESEGVGMVGWCDAIRWVPDEIWERHGLTIFRHPDVERIILDEEEDLAEELAFASDRRSPSLVAPDPSA